MKKTNTLFSILFLLPVLCFSQDYWELLHTNDTTTIWSIQIAKDGTIYYGGTGGLFISHDNGETWECKPILFYLGIYTMAFDLDSNLIIGATNYLYKYKINEDEWELLLHPEEVYGFTAILVDSSQILAGTVAELYRFKSGIWDTLNIDPLGIGLTDIVQDNDGRLIIGATNYTGGGGVSQSLDNGETWTLLGLYNSYIKDLEIDAQDRLYAGSIGNEFGDGGLYRYDHETETWDTLSNNARVQSLFFNEEDSLYAGIYSQGGNGGAWMSPDYGDTWIKISSGLNQNNTNVSDFTEDQSGYLYTVVGNDAIYRSTDSTITNIQNDNYKIHSKLQVYPNPFSTSTTLQFNLNITDAGTVEIKIYDQVGKVVQHIPVKSAVKGVNTVELNMQDLPSGIYYYSLFINGRQTDTRKMVVAR